jgi:hypothetical protein
MIHALGGKKYVYCVLSDTKTAGGTLIDSTQVPS